MKNKSKADKKTILKRVAAGGLFFTVFSLSAGSAFLLFPQATIVQREESPEYEIIDAKATGRELFISNLTNSATNGLSITANKLLFELDGKNETVVNDNVESVVSHVNTFDASGTTIDLALDSLSLHGINLALTAPITYSDAGNRKHERGIHASMINEMIYLNLFDAKIAQGPNDLPTVEYNDTWDFKYKVDVSSMDVHDNDSTVTDVVTGGIERYEYGMLDWLIEDIFEILSQGGVNLSLEGWIDKLGGSSEAPESSSSGSISTDDIMESLGSMAEVEHEGKPYFVWKLPLGEKEIELGMRSDAEYNFIGIDLPALYDVTPVEDQGETTYVKTPNDASSWEIQEGMRVVANADVANFVDARDGWNETLIPGDVNSYKELQNSRKLFESVASYVANPQFGLDVNLDFGHSSEAKEGDRTHLKQEASSDAIRLSLSADADLSQRKFHGLGANLSLQKIDHDGENETIRAHQDVNLAYLYDQEGKEGDGYLDINGELFKAHTTKTYLDEFYAEVLKDAFSSGSTEEKAEGENTLNQVQEVLNKVGLTIDGIVNSALLKDIKNGVYVSAMDFIKRFYNEDNLIVVELTLEPIGLEGEVVLTLRGTDERSDLLNIAINGIKFASFTLDGTIKTRPFQTLKDKSSYGEDYQDLAHLKGIGEQVKDIVHEEAFSAKLDVELKEGEEELLTLGGDMAFAFAEGLKQGKVDLRAKQGLTDKIVANHRIALDLRDGYENIAFAYASDTNADHLDTLPDDAIKSKLSIESFGTVLDTVMDRVDAIDDRFSRLISSFQKEAGTSLLSRVTGGEISALLEEEDLISSAKLHDENGNTTIVVNASALSLEDDLVISLSYLDSDENKEGGIKGLSVSTAFGGKSFSLSLGDIEAKEIKQTVNVVEMEDNVPVEKEVTQIKDGAAEEFQNFDSVDSFHDINFIGELAEYAVGALTLGTTAAKDEEGNKIVSGVSHYGLEGDLGVKIGTHDLKLALFDAYASVEGAETKIYANLGGIPVIRGVNGPDSDIYFRPNEAEGERASSIYYYANGIDPKGQALLTRDSSYGRVRNVRDGVRLEGEQFTSDLFGWLGRYSLGIVDSILDKDSSAQAHGSSVPHHRAGPGLLGDQPLRIETVVKGLTKEHDDLTGKDTYVIAADIGKLLGIDVLAEAKIALTGEKVVNGEGVIKTLTEINVHADASALAANTGNALHLVGVDVSLRLNNIVNGTMENVWTPAYAGNEYASLFVGNVSDDGVIDPDEMGLLYELPDHVFNDLEGKETKMFGYNYIGLEAKAGNHWKFA